MSIFSLLFYIISNERVNLHIELQIIFNSSYDLLSDL